MVHDRRAKAWENGAVPTDRRTLVVVLVALAVAAPAAALRAMCVGRSCRPAEPADASVPFCSLPRDVRDLLVAGFYEGRGAHVMAVAGKMPVGGGKVERALPAPWPAVDPEEEGVVPLVFSGAGVRPGASVPDGTTLDAVAPTVAEAIGLDRPHPGVRSGRAIPGVADGSTRPRLVVLVVWKGVGVSDLRGEPSTWPTLRALARENPSTMRAEVGSLPLDPAAVLTTIGTGALPEDHGITGTLVRSDRGHPVRAWGGASPPSVVAALGDDLNHLLEQRPQVGVVVSHLTDRGIVGGDWYVEADDNDTLAFAGRSPGAAAEQELTFGYGRDAVPDLLGVVMAEGVRKMDRALRRVMAAAQRVSRGRALVVVTATGSATGPGVPASEVEYEVNRRLGVDVVEAMNPGGLFLDQRALASSGLTDDRVVAALRRVPSPAGGPLLADAFPQVAVTFARYC
jgi:hypothetical protein